MSILPITSATALVASVPTAVNVATSAVSQFGGLLQGLIPNLSASTSAKEVSQPAANKPTEATSKLVLNKLQSQASQVQSEVEKEIRETLEKNGIPVQQNISFNLDAYGKVQVVGNHPQKEAIEKSLATHPELRENIAKLSGLTNLLKAAKPPKPTTGDEPQQPQEFQIQLTPTGSEVLS